MNLPPVIGRPVISSTISTPKPLRSVRMWAMSLQTVEFLEKWQGLPFGEW